MLCYDFFSFLPSKGVVIGFNPTLYTVSEDDGEVFLTVRVLQGALERPVVVNLSTSNGLGMCKYTFVLQEKIYLAYHQIVCCPLNWT